MVKLLIYSDLHLDHCPFFDLQIDGRRVDEAADMVVLAGDIHEGVKGIRWARETFPDKAILYVTGNHEYYDKHWSRLLDEFRVEALKYDVNFLEANGVDIQGVRFLGCSLWTDFELFGNDLRTHALRRAKSSMNDYHYIAISRSPEFYWVHSKKLIPELTVRRHHGSVEWLQSKLAKGDPTKTVIVTHHAPHLNSVPERYASDILSTAYASDLTRLMGQAHLWIHGHIHDSVDYVVNGTRVVSNPRGYMLRNGAFENARFQQEFLIEV